MTEPLQFGPHLDADRIAAFSEGTLTPWERQESLAHMAVCAECRKVVFLAQESLPVPEPAAKEEGVRGFWRNWSPLGYSLAGAMALVCLLAVSVTLWNRSQPVTGTGVASAPPAPPVAQKQEQRTETKTPGSATKSSDRKADQGRPIEKAAPPSAASPPSPEQARPEQLTLGHLKEEQSNPETQASADLSASRPPTPQKRASVAGLAAAPQAAPRASSVKNLPLNGRNIGAMMALADKPAEAAAASAEPALPPAEGPLNLRVEHQQTRAGSLAKISGAVLDGSGASVAGATVNLRRSSEAAGREVTTDAAGRFTLASVPAGRYELQISAPGFRTVNRPIDLQGNDLALLTSQLEIGAVTESVQVTAEAPLLQTESASIGMVIPKLPGGEEPEQTVSQGNRMLALDRSGVLYRSTNRGKKWKKVKPQWTGKATEIAASSDEGFELTTEAHIVWLSQDGEHWKQR